MGVASIINKAEIQLYSTLISVMSGINHLKTGDQPIAKSAVLEMPTISIAPDLTYDVLPEKPAAMRWQSIRQTLLSILLWTILGFAGGFLIGMIAVG